MTVGYFCKSFVWHAWLGSEYAYNLFILSYLSFIYLLFCLFIHFFYLLTSVFVSRVYILAASRSYSYMLSCFTTFV